MPVVLDLIDRTPVSGQDCASQTIVTAAVPVDHRGGEQIVLTKQRAAVIRQGQKATVSWTMVSSDGLPIDLAGCGVPDSDSSSSASSTDNALSLELRIAEATCEGTTVYKVTGYSPDPTSGFVQAEVPQTVFSQPGIYTAEFALINNDEDDTIAFSNQFFLVVERGLFGGAMTGPPTLAEVRLHLRDFPEENLLLDTIDFDAAEVAMMLQKPVLYWNETPPPIRRYTTQNFPFRYMWLEGCAAQLCFLAAEYCRRNFLEHSAGGTAVNDKNREQNYLMEGQRRWTGFVADVKAKKVSINAASFSGTFGSPYGW